MTSLGSSVTSRSARISGGSPVSSLYVPKAAAVPPKQIAATIAALR
ncbi:MAG: hypothetical protein AB4040_14675 [Synechococcus sp.]